MMILQESAYESNSQSQDVTGCHFLVSKKNQQDSGRFDK